MLPFTIPLERHDEGAWGRRLHLPTQMFARSLRDLSVAHHGRFIDVPPAGDKAPPRKARPPARRARAPK